MGANANRRAKGRGFTKLTKSLGIAIALVGLAGSAAQADSPAPSPLGFELPKTLDEAEHLLGLIDKDLGRVQSRETQVEQRAKIAQARAVVRARAYVRLARAGLLPVSGGFAQFVNHAMKVEGARRAIKRDMRLVTNANQELKVLRQTLAKLHGRKAAVSAQRDALAQAADVLREAEDRRRAFNRAFKPSEDNDGNVAVYGTSGISIRPAGSPEPDAIKGFEAMLGRLPMPIAGRAEVRDVRRRSATGDGLELKATKGTTVRAVFPGRVAFAGKYADYGRLVIVDHGDKYFSLYGNLRKLGVKVGDEVKRGTRLAQVAKSKRGAFLYFELRHGEETINARRYLGLLPD